MMATSHSPYLLTALDTKEVWLKHQGNGLASRARLSAHPDFDRWKEMMTPGEFWSMIGEGWIENHPPVQNATRSFPWTLRVFA